MHLVLKVIKKEKSDVCQQTSDLLNEIHKIIRKEISPHALALKKLSESVIKAHSDENFTSEFNKLKTYIINHGFKNEAFNFIVFKAIYRFRYQFEPKGKFESGKHFNYQLLDEIAKLYNVEHAAPFNNEWNTPKNTLRWQKIFGWIERFVPACDAQIIAQGPFSILYTGIKLGRSLNYNWGGGKYFPLNCDSDWELGVNCGAISVWCGGKSMWNKMRGWGKLDTTLFNNYAKQKHGPILCRSNVEIRKRYV